jgi:hypothetical protein
MKSDIALAIRFREQLEALPVAPGEALISVTRPGSSPVKVRYDKPGTNPTLQLTFSDCESHYGHLIPPTREDAQRIVGFANSLSETTKFLTIQCETGVGISCAIAAGLMDIMATRGGTDNSIYYKRTSYNRRLWKLIREAGGLPPVQEPLATILLHAGWPVDRVVSFVMSMKRQRWENWSLLITRDFIDPEHEVVAEMDSRIHFLPPFDGAGGWGHPQRIRLITSHGSLINGEWIGFNSDDNYLCPGYLDQLIDDSDGADLVMCHFASSYSGWRVCHTQPKIFSSDLGCFLAKRSLVAQVPWTGTGYAADGEYIQELAKHANKVKVLPRVLYTHN